jgi:hypothetical protein
MAFYYSNFYRVHPHLLLLFFLIFSLSHTPSILHPETPAADGSSFKAGCAGKTEEFSNQTICSEWQSIQILPSKTRITLLTLWPQMSGIREVVCYSHLLGYIVLFLTSSKNIMTWNKTTQVHI